MLLSSRPATAFLFAVLVSIVSITATTSAVAADDLGAMARRVVDLTNQERQKAGIPPLQWNDTLAASGATHATDMAAHNYFSHTSLDGADPVERARRAGYPTYGWGGLYVGENLAKGYSSADGATQGWMASADHRTNLLLAKYREIGVAIAAAPDGTLYWAQEFGSRPKVLPMFINGGSATTDNAQVTLAITSEDVSSWGSVGPITGMMISNNSDFSGSSWESFSSKKAWTLSGQSGTNRVYAMLRDAAGNTVQSNGDIQYVGRVVAAPPAPQPIALQVAGSAVPQVAPQFKLGFKLLADLLGGRAGGPVENEHYAGNGDSLQTTTSGLLVWRKADNWTAYTNGYRTWINGPRGIQERANNERFSWESK